MTTTVSTPAQKLAITWPLLPEDFILPDDPVENTDRPLMAASLRQPLTSFPELCQDALIVSNFALYAAIDEQIICKAPDWMEAKRRSAEETQALLTQQRERSQSLLAKLREMGINSEQI